MVIENDPSARMQVRSRGQLVAPASCAVCGNATCDEGYLDLNVFIDFHGTVYLCMNCITQGAETVGMFTPTEVKNLTNQIEGLMQANEALTLELHNVTEQRDSYSNALRHAYSDSGTNGTVSAASPKDVLETPERPAVREPEPEESVTFTKPSRTSGTKLRDRVTFE